MSSDMNDRHLRARAAEGCEEARLLVTRRAMLGVTAGLFSAAFLPRSALAADGDARLLVVVLRGGMDGLTTVAPIGDPSYAKLRGAIAIPAGQAIRLDGEFGLHPSLVQFGRMFAAKEAAVVHATCVPLRNRSHFDCQDNLENGFPGVAAANATGWLNRLLSALPSGDPVAQHGAIQVGEAPLILRGPAPVLGWSPTWFTEADRETTNRVLSAYKAVDGTLYGALTRGLEADRLAETADAGDDGDISELRKGFRGAARLLRTSAGPRIAVLSVGNWDTHSGQGGVEGFLADRLTELDTALADFRRECGPVWAKTVVVCATEFGRTARVNGDNGTDHGVGTVALLAGGAVAGGKVFGDWPGLAPSQLFEDSDLKATTDLRAVFKGILRDHLDVPAGMLDRAIFPESARVKPFAGLVAGASAKTPVESVDAGAAVALRPLSPIARYRARRGAPG
jgi:uncharacterized protein (DUF1501 family)